jgi:hypothetical protein
VAKRALLVPMSTLGLAVSFYTFVDPAFILASYLWKSLQRSLYKLHTSPLFSAKLTSLAVDMDDKVLSSVDDVEFAGPTRAGANMNRDDGEMAFYGKKPQLKV